jgi:DnaJ domain
MNAINPLMMFFPESVSFLIYGLFTGFLLKFWKIAKRNIIFILIFLYAYAVWLASMAMLMIPQSHERQAWFIFGFILTFLSIFSIIRTIIFTPFVFAYENITDRMGERRANRRDQERREERERNDRTQDQQNQDLFRQEQARREAEARVRRGGSDRTRSDNDRIEDQRDQQRPPPPTGERRSYEQILGLSNGWTQEDLRKAYQREANRTHPDKWIGKPQAVQDAMEDEYKAVQEAYRNLKR